MSALLPDINDVTERWEEWICRTRKWTQDLVCANSLGTCTIKEDILAGCHPASISPDECDKPVCGDVFLHLRFYLQC